MKPLIRLILTCLMLIAPLSCRKKEAADLVIVSPHTQQIQQEFGQAFQAWHQQRFGRTPQLQWRDVGGSKEITRFLKAHYDRGASPGIDVYFGGGTPDHQFLARNGGLQPVQLPDEILADIPEKIGGIAQYDAAAGWYGACLSSFGILYNSPLLAARHLPAPRQWSDLADPAMLGWVSGAGPESGSAIAAYEIIVQSAPDWPTGWQRLLRFWGNCRTFTQGASDVPVQVRNGQILAGAIIDFYAFTEIAHAQADVLKYVAPAGGTAFSPDPISVLHAAPNRQMAERFLEFVLSPAGQALWCLPPGHPAGPTNHALYRQPIRRDAYTRYTGQMLAPLVDVFALAEAPDAFHLDGRLQAIRTTHILPRLMRAAAIDNENLHPAWKRIVEKGLPQTLLLQFAELPPELATTEALLNTAERLAQAQLAGDEQTVERITAEWRRFFREKYDRILRD